MENFETTYPTKNLKLLHEYDTIFSADSVEWCPHDGMQHFFACGNYQLVEDESKGTSDKPRSRLGRILLFSIQPEKPLTLHQTIESAAILDQKWCRCLVENASLLGVVNAAKTLSIYRLNKVECKLDLVTSYTVIDDDKETLLLSLDWNTGKYDNSEPELICSDSKGNIHRFIYRSDTLELVTSWHAHEYEAWIAAFYYWKDDIMFTGGDDSLLLKFDLRTGNDPIGKNRSHEAGVVSMHSNSKQEYVLATGSYDGYLRIFDIRQMKHPTSSLQLPGTLWRVKWDPFKADHILTACMLGGVHVIDATNINNLEIAESFYKHKNLAYGSDWCHLKTIDSYDSDRNVIIGSCSFYDHLLCISSIKLNTF